MRILMLRNPAESLGCKLTEGGTGEVSTELGEQLVRLGIAVALEENQKPTKAKEPTVKGVPPKASIAESKPSEIAGDKKTETKE
jgi:hypothetical protein